MKYLPLISSICTTPRRRLYTAIAAQMIVSAGAQAAPNGGTIVGGDAVIEQFGVDTTIIQNTDRLAIDWESFNIAAEERVQFIQPDSSSVALNRILGNDATQIFGRLDANGHVILMNPNGVLFGEGASVNVGGLVATGLNINADDFMNGEFVLQAVDGKDGTVINKGIINAATGGSVALIGKQVDNQGLISAKLGSVTLAAGKEAVLTFDNQGLLGVRVSKEILQDEIGVDAAVANSGDINAEGGRVLLTGSVSQDIFSQAVNADGLNAKTSVVMHEDGSFTLGAGADVINTGTISTSSETTEAGQIVVLGENINSSGAILANSKTASTAGNIEVHSRDTTLLTEDSTTSATNNGAGSGGQIKILGNRVGILDQSKIDTSGTNGGGDINIGGGFQGKEAQLRNATRTVIGKDTLIEANAITEGDGGDVIVWADETTSFTGEINVRGGELGGDGGFVEVSGKENLRFLGSVDRTAVRGENGTLLLDPEIIVIVRSENGSTGEDDIEIDDQEILFDDGTAAQFTISDAAITRALLGGDVVLQAVELITTDQLETQIFSIVVPDESSLNSLMLESGGSIYLENIEVDLGAGDLSLIAGISDLCAICTEGSNANLDTTRFSTTGNLLITAPDLARAELDNWYNPLNRSEKNPNNIDIYGSNALLSISSNNPSGFTVNGDINISSDPGEKDPLVILPSGAMYQIPLLRQSSLTTAFAEIRGYSPSTLSIYGNLNLSAVREGLDVDAQAAKLSQINIDSLAENSINIESNGDVELSYSLISNKAELPSDVSIKAAGELRFIRLDEDAYYTGISGINGGNIYIAAADLSGVRRSILSNYAYEMGRQGTIEIFADSDILLPNIDSSGDIRVTSTQGSIISQFELRVFGETHLNAQNNIHFENLDGSNNFSFLDVQDDVYLTAGGDIRFAAVTSHALYQLGSAEFILPDENQASIILDAGSSIDVERMELGLGSLLITSQQDITLPEVSTGGSLIVESALGSVSFAGVLNVGGDTSLSAAEDIVFLAAGAGESDVPASIFSENGDVRLSARNINIGNWDENHAPLDIGGSFTVNFAESARIKGILDANEGVEISTQTGMLSLGWGSINTLGSFSANLANGTYDGGLETGGFMSIDAGQIDIIGSALLLADVELNGDSTLGTGDINITITGDGEFAYPSINRQRLVTTGNLNIDLQSQGATTRFYGDESSAINVDGAATISAIGDLIIPDLDVKGDLSVTSAQGGITFTKSTFEAPTLSSLVTVEGDATLRAGAAVLLTEGSSLNVAGETKITSEDDISFLETSIFLPGDNVYLTSGNDINFAASSNLNDPGFIELAESNPASFIFSSGRNVVIDSGLILGSGDFIASSGTKAHSPSDFPLGGAGVSGLVRTYDGPGIFVEAIDTNGKIIFRSAYGIDTPYLESGANGSGGFIGYYTNGSVVLPHYANANGNFEVFNFEGAENLISNIQLSDGSMIELPSIVSFESIDAGYVGWYGSGVENTLATSGGDFYIEAREIQHWGGNALDVSSASGHGNITLIAAEEIQAPPMIYSNLLGPGADQFSEIRLSASKIRIDRDIDFNNAGVVDLSLEAGGDVIIGVVEDDLHYLELSAFDRRVGGKIFDSSGGDSDQLNIQITSAGTVFQKYDLFTGGGNYSATASEFQFNDLIVLNTDFANETQDALSGNGNVSIQSTSDQAELVLPGITTQTDCVDTIVCGTLSVSAASVVNKGEIRVSGNAGFDIAGRVRLNSSYTPVAGQLVDLRNYFGGEVSVNADFAEMTATQSLSLGEWNLNSTDSASFIAMQDADAASTIIGNKQLNVAGTFVLGAGYVELKNPESRVGALNLSANRTEIEYSGDLRLSGYLFGDASGSKSMFKVGGNLSISLIAGGFISDTPILEVDSAGGMVLDVAGNIALLGERNRLSSVQILNAQNVEIFNNGELTLDGVNAESLSLNVLGNIAQSEALTISGGTSITAATGTNIDLSNPLNDFNTLSVQATGPSVINIADSGSISLADIDLNGAGQGGALSVAAANIIQAESGRILLQDSAQLNLQADYITLGANGTASIDINGAVLNGVFTNDLNIQGAIRGAAGVADTRLAGLYFNGSVADNFMEVVTGASISGDFREGSKISMGDGNDIANIAGDVAVAIEGGAGEDTFIIASPNVNIAQILGGEDLDILRGPDADNSWTVGEGGVGTLATPDAATQFIGIERIEGGNASDNFVIQSTSVAIELIGGDGIDSLTGNLNDSAVNNQWNIDGINSGSLNELVLFTSVEDLTGNDGADSVTFTVGAQIGDVSTGLGDDIFTLAADITTGLLDAGGGQDTLNLNGLDSIYTYLNELIGGGGNYTTSGFEIENNEGGSKTIVGVDGYDAEWTIDGDGTVTVTVNDPALTPNTFSGVTRLEGASGDDTFILLAGGQLADQIIGGQGGVDTLQADNGQNNSWLINGINSGQLNAEADNTSLVFQGIANLVGGAGDDIFEIATGGSITGSIDGGLGNDTLMISDTAATNNWQLGPQNSVGLAAQFQNIETLVGNANADRFTVIGMTDVTALAGNGGANLVNWQAGSLELDLAAGTLNSNITINEIGAIEADASLDNSVIGFDADTLWVLSAEYSGIASNEESGVNVTFAGFNSLQGGEGLDTLRGSELGLRWWIEGAGQGVLSQGEVTRALLFTGMDSLVGGDGNDEFYGMVANPEMSIDGGGGDNSFDVPLLPSSWTLIERGGGSLTIGSPDNAAISFKNFSRLASEFGGSSLLLATTDIDGMRIELGGRNGWAALTNGTDSGADWILDSFGNGSLRFGTSELIFTQASYISGSQNPDATDRLFGPGESRGTEPLTYQFNSAYSGFLEDGEGLNSPSGRFSFGGIQEVHAGNSDNVFVLGSATATTNYVGSIFGGDGDDLFLVDTTVNSSISALLHGGGGTNTLIANRDNALNNVWTIDGVNSGTLNTGVQFFDIQDLQGNGGNDTFTFAGNSGIGHIDAGAGDDIFVLANNITAGILDGGEGTDTLNLNGLNSIYTYLNELIGGGGNYTASGFEIENNEGGSKTIVGVDGYGAEWVVDGDGSVEVTARQGDVTVVNRFSGVTRLQGASGQDTFILQDGYIADGIVGSQDGTDTLVADTGVQNHWSIDGVNSGKVSTAGSEREQLFEAIANLVGGSDNDIFNILSGADFDGTISGGGGENSLAVVDPSATSVWTIASTNDVRIQSSADAVSQITFSDIQSLIGNDNEDVLDLSAIAGSVDLEQQSAGDFAFQAFDTFISSGGNFVGPGTDATWILNETSDVSFTDQNDATHQIQFLGFKNLYGGAGEDYFRIDGHWFAEAGAIYAGTLSEAVDTAELNIEGASAWSFNSSDNTAVYTGLTDPESLFSASRTEALNALSASSNGVFHLVGIERNLGGEGDDVFFVYGDSDLYNPYVDGRGGNDYLLAYNWGTPEDLAWNITEDFGGNINDAVVFRNFENLKSHDFIATRPDEHVSYFNIAEGVAIGTLVGDASNTTFNIGSGASVGAILDNGGIDTINVSDGANSWLLEESGGSLNSTTFVGIEILNGGSGSDEFIITSPATQVTQINGGVGSNSLTAFDQDNSWTLSASGGTLNDSLQFADITSLIGGAGVDAFFVDGDSVFVGLDGGLGSNQLIATGAADNAWLIDGANTGSLNSAMTFERIQNLSGGAGSDTFTFAANASIGNIDAGAGDDTFILANNITAGILDGGDGQDTLDRGGLNSIITYLREVIGGDAVYTTANIETETSTGGSTTVVGVDGYDAQWTIAGDGIINVTATGDDGVAIVNQFTGVTRAEGGSGTDEFILLDGGSLADGIAGNGDDSLKGSDTTNTWSISAANGGQLFVEENSTTLLFQGIANLLGGSGSDAFDIMAGGSITGSIYGGAGADSLIISDSSVTNNWQLGAMNSVGLVAPFEQIETVIGNGNDDTFTFTGTTDVVSVQGRAGANTVLWMAGDTTVNLVTNQINEIIEFADISSFIAEQTTDNVLIGADSDNVWTLDGVASGTVANAESTVAFIGFQSLLGGAAGDDFVLTGDAAGFAALNGSAGSNAIAAADQANQWLLDGEGGDLNGIRFANMEALTGGALQDEFILVDVISQAQVIDGGAGDNRLLGYDQANTWEVTADNAGSVTGLSRFSNIQTLVGGSAADTFTLSAGVNLSEIFGGAGNDVFVIGEGVVAENFYGETGDDSFDVGVGLVLSGVLDGGSGGETDGDYINLSKYTLLDATADLESVLGFAFRNFERIDEPNNQGVYFGGNGTNFWYITGANEGRLEIRGGDNAGVYEFSGVHSLLGGEGEDFFIFANDSAAVSTLIDGGEGVGANTLDLSAQGLINQWLLNGANGGLVSNDSNTSGNVFTNIAYLIGGSNRDIFELQAGGSIAGAIDGGLGSDELLVAVEQTSSWQLGGAGGHSVTGIASFTNIEALTGSAGSDIFDVLAELTDVTQLSGGAGSDAVNFLYEAPVSVDLASGLAGGLRVEGIEQFTAVDARSTFTGVNSAATWTVDGVDQGSIQYLLESDGSPVNVAFDGFGNLTGGADDDQFIVTQGGSVSGILSGGNGRNTVDLQELNSDIHVAVAPEVSIAEGPQQLTLADVDQLIGNGRTWLYGASDRSYTWTIDGARSGQMTSTLVDDSNRLLAFENLAAIRGGAHDDIFRVMTAAPLLSLDGGSAVTADLVDYSQVNGNLRINLADALSGQNGVITGVEGIRGNNSGADSLHSAELVGPDGGAIWSIGDLGGDGLADGINDGEVVFGEQVITFIDFNLLTGGAGADTFNQTNGVVLGTLNGGAGDDTFNIEVTGANAGTRIVGGDGNDTLLLRGGEAAGSMTYTAASDGGEFDYGLASFHYKVSHQDVENLLDRTLAESLDIRGSNAAETFTLANGRFWVNGGDVIEYHNKRDIAVRSGINDTIEIADNLVVEDTLTLANGTVIANDPASSSITAAALILDSTRDVGLSSARLRTSVDDLFVRNSAGDIYLQEQNGLNLAEFNANGVFDLLLLNGDLTNSAPVLASDVFRVVTNNGNITLTGANQLRDDVAVTGNRVELHNASTLTLVEVNAEDLYLRTQRGIEGDDPITVAGLTDIDASGDVLFDFATNDFNRVRVTNAVNLTLVDQNAIELLDINVSGTVVVRSTNAVTLTDNVTGANGVDVSSGTGSINQNGSISTNSGSVVVSAGNGEVNLGEDAHIIANGGSVSINAGAGNVNMGGDTRIAANGGDVNIVAADSVVVAEVVSSGNVSINAGSGSVSDGNGGATNVSAGGLQSSSNTGFGSDDALETNVGSIDITTNTGNVAVNNTGNVSVDNVSTGQGDISLVNQGNVELGGGSVVAENGTNGGSVNIDVSKGSVSQSGSTSVPAVKGGGVVVINAPDGAIGEGGGLRVDAPFVEIIAAIKAGDIFVNPGADKIEYFSGSFKFDDQLLAVEPLEDINPAIFANVRSYFFNDISLLLPRDQLYDEDDEE